MQNDPNCHLKLSCTKLTELFDCITGL